MDRIWYVFISWIGPKALTKLIDDTYLYTISCLDDDGINFEDDNCLVKTYIYPVLYTYELLDEFMKLFGEHILAENSLYST